jgi:O-antigen/teichoic acid export membrane protein
MSHIYKLVTRWILTLIIPVLVLIILFSTKIMLLFGADFIQSSNALIILSIGTSIFAIFGVSGTALVVSGYQKLNLVNTLSVTILNICLNIILIPKFGIMGAAYATLSSMSLIAIARIIETQIFLKINPYNFKIFKSILAGILTYGVLQYIKPHLMVYHTIITLILALIMVLVIYGALLLLFKFDEDDKDFLRSLNFLKNKVIKPNSYE